MHPADSPLEILSVASVILVLLLNCHRALILDACCEEEEAYPDDPFSECSADRALVDLQDVSQAALHQWTLWNSLTIMDEDLGFWVKL